MTDHSSKLLAAATSTFEQLGFLFADYEMESWQAEAPLDATARVPFSGPFDGAVEVQLTESLLAGLAANMLGEEDGADPGVWSDALGEVANVICGNVLPQIAGPSAVFDLGSPQVALSGSPLPTSQHQVVTSGELGVEEGRTRVTLYADGLTEQSS